MATVIINRALEFFKLGVISNRSLVSRERCMIGSLIDWLVIRFSRLRTTITYCFE